MTKKPGMKLVTVVLSALIACAFVGGIAVAEEPFAPPKISAWDGKAWGPLKLGRTTQEGVKRDFRDGRGDFRNSVELKTAPDMPYKINALFRDVSKNAPLDGIVIRYRNDSGDGLPLSDLKQAIGDAEMQTRYPTTRHEDWQIASWPRRGIVALVLGGRASWILLGDPGKVASVASSLLASEPPAITPVPDPGQGKTKEIVYGSVDATFSLTRIRLDHKDREVDYLESDLRRAGDGRGRQPLRYERGAYGTYSLSITARSNDDKDGDGTVSASLSGQTPYGKISVYSSESFRVEKGRSNLEDTRYDRAVSKVERDVEEKAARALDAQGPPTAETVRREQWTALVEQYRNAKAGSGGGGLL